MLILRRLKSLGASTHQLLDVLNKQVLSVLFLGAPAWYGQLTIAEKTHLNRVLRCGLHIIYGDSYRSFNQSLSRAGMLSVTEQLQGLLTNRSNIINSESGSNTDLKPWLTHGVSRPSFSQFRPEPTDTLPHLSHYSPPLSMTDISIIYLVNWAYYCSWQLAPYHAVMLCWCKLGGNTKPLLQK